MASMGGQQSCGIIKQTSTALSRSEMTRPTDSPGHLERNVTKADT